MWSVKKQKEDKEKLFYVNETAIEELSRVGHRRSYHTILMKGDHSFCEVILWACGSCALSEFRGLNYDLLATEEDVKSLIEFLKTDPFHKIDGWAHKIFIFVPGQARGLREGGSKGWKYFLTQCKPISTFPNHAHGRHSLTLFQLDVS